MTYAFVAKYSKKSRILTNSIRASGGYDYEEAGMFRRVVGIVILCPL